MDEVIKKLFLKIIVLLIITILPIWIYLYTDNRAQYIFNKKTYEARNKYIITAEFKPEERIIHINEKISFVNNSNNELNKIYLCLFPNLLKHKEGLPYDEYQLRQVYPNGFDSGSVDIKRIKVEGNNARYKLLGKSNSILAVYLLDTLKAGEKIYIDIMVSIKLPISAGYLGINNDTCNIINWYPIVISYDDKWNLNSFDFDISNYHVEFIVPKGYTPATTGRVIKKVEFKDKICYYIEALNVRDFVIILSSKFKINEGSVDDIKIVYYYLKDEYKDDVLEYASLSIRTFNHLFGKYPYNEFKIVSSNFFCEGKSYPNLIILNNKILNHKNPSKLIEHIITYETAKQWWNGIIKSKSQNERWLNDSLIEYSTILYNEYNYSRRESMHINNNLIDKNPKSNMISDMSSKVLSLMDLRNTVGDNKFFEILRRFYEDYKFTDTTVLDFINVYLEIIGDNMAD